MNKCKFRKFSLLIVSKILKFSPKKQSECVLLSSHIPIQNLGDQALLAGCIEGLVSFSKIHIIQTGVDSPELAIEKLGIDSKNLFFYSQFREIFASEKSFLQSLKFLVFLARFKKCFVIGADVLDGTYNRHEPAILFQLLNYLTLMGTSVTILGSSFSKIISNEAIEGIKNLNRNVTFFCRDEFSLLRIEKIFPAKLSSDVAFLMKPSDSFQMYHKKDFRDDSSSKNISIGICLKEGDFITEENLIKFVNFISSFQYSGHSPLFVFVPHHPRDLSFSQRISSMMQVDGNRIVLPRALPAANEVKAIVSKCDIVITGRMHVAIAALDCSVIPICFSYGDKFGGLLKHFGLDENELIVEEGGGNVDVLLNRCLNDKSRITNVINLSKKSVRIKAALNFGLE